MKKLIFLLSALALVSISAISAPIDELFIDAIGINPFRFRLGKMFPDPASQIGKDIEGFKLIAYKEKYEEREVKGKMMKVNVSEYTLERKGKKIILIYGQDRQHDEYLIRFFHIPTNTKIVRSMGATFEIGGVQHLVSNIDIKKQTCTIVNQKTGEERIIEKKPQLWIEAWKQIQTGSHHSADIKDNKIKVIMGGHGIIEAGDMISADYQGWTYKWAVRGKSKEHNSDTVVLAEMLIKLGDKIDLDNGFLINRLVAEGVRGLGRDMMIEQAEKSGIRTTAKKYEKLNKQAKKDRKKYSDNIDSWVALSMIPVPKIQKVVIEETLKDEMGFIQSLSDFN